MVNKALKQCVDKSSLEFRLMDRTVCVRRKKIGCALRTLRRFFRPLVRSFMEKEGWVL